MTTLVIEPTEMQERPAVKLTPKLAEQALATLEGMHTIARAEMMEAGNYIEDRPSRPRRRHQVCQGYRACAIGSLWLAGGVRINHHDDIGALLPGTSQGQRDAFLSTRGRRHLIVALHFLNRAAERYMDEHEIHGNEALYVDAVEALFESDDLHGWPHRVPDPHERRTAMMTVIREAKRNLRAAI